jgi:hypothetical protein
VHVLVVLPRRRENRKRGASRVWWGNLRERDHLEDVGTDGRIILNQIFKMCGGEYGLD